jgi:hypothetical protein
VPPGSPPSSEQQLEDAGIQEGHELKIRIYSKGKVIYFRAPTAFLRTHAGTSDPATLARLSGKWIRSTDTSQFGPFANGPTTMKSVVAPSLDNAVPDWTRVRSTVVRGSACDEVHSAAAGTTVDVTRRDGYPVVITGQDGKDSAAFALSQFGTAALPAPPAASTVISAD